MCRRSINKGVCLNMFLSFQDRLRIPWKGGAKQVSFDAIVPGLTIPLIIGIGAINLYCCFIITFATICLLFYVRHSLQKVAPRSRFFFMWTLWSIIYLLLLFEITVPLFELLPEENCILVVLVCFSLFCTFKTRRKAMQNSVLQNLALELESGEKLMGYVEEHTTAPIRDAVSNDDCHMTACRNCRKNVLPKTFHCYICQVCVIKQSHHSLWLDCCIGESNQKFYTCTLVFGACSLFLGANLILTSVCHPVLIFQILSIHFLLPDDCSEVFEQYEMGVSFVISAYSIVFGTVILSALFLHLFFLTKGVTYVEWRSSQKDFRTSLSNTKDFFVRNV